ncbi:MULTISPECIES: MobC family plasmid mobilization relaxosome protein [Brevibacillus]|uniref:MobC family plasmid mobilization relaxosome protein n=1 Tax=Brevibacillus TaxID=55080 RepID=UPI0018CC91D6|nr:MobC family plasmid mobilization relaxosome protein [Brevibacillus agri]MBG9568197.1 hypothetical protein [Brevibacillus agri]
MNKTELIKVRVTQDELEIIDKKAQVAGLKRSQYVRKICTQGYIVIRNFDEVEKLVYEINKIGNNINQIARKANEFDYLSKDDLKSIRSRIDEVYKLIESFYDEG